MTETTRVSGSTSSTATWTNAAGHRRLLRGTTLVAAAAAAFVVWIVSVPVLGIALQIGSDAMGQTITPVAVIVVPLLSGGAAWGLLALFERFFARGVLAWRIVGWSVLALSLAAPVTMAASAAALVSLLLMHLVTGAVLVLGLGTFSRRR